MLICVSLMIVRMKLAFSQHCQCRACAQGIRVEYEGWVYAVQAGARGDGRGGRECVGQWGADPLIGQRRGEGASICGHAQGERGTLLNDRHAHALQEGR